MRSKRPQIPSQSGYDGWCIMVLQGPKAAPTIAAYSCLGPQSPTINVIVHVCGQLLSIRSRPPRQPKKWKEKKKIEKEESEMRNEKRKEKKRKGKKKS